MKFESSCTRHARVGRFTENEVTTSEMELQSFASLGTLDASAVQPGFCAATKVAVQHPTAGRAPCAPPTRSRNRASTRGRCFGPYKLRGA